MTSLEEKPAVAFEATLIENDLLKPFRQKGWQSYEKINFPEKKQEAFQYVHLRELSLSSFEFSQPLIEKSSIADLIFPGSIHSHIVFVNGRLSIEMSDISAVPSQAILLPLSQAMRSHGSFLQNHLSRSVAAEKDPLVLLNFALHPEGAFFYLPPNLTECPAIQCLNIITGLTPQHSCSRVHLVVGACTQIDWINTTHAFEKENAHLGNHVMEAALETDAHVNVYYPTSSQQPLWHFEALRATLKRNAKLTSVSVTEGSRVHRMSYAVSLKGENSEASLKGLWKLTDKKTAHTHVMIEHAAPHTRSMQLFKGLLNDASQSSFEGKIYVHPEAQKTEAYQLNKNLLLSPNALANSKPNLEIFADDVKASHGATVSQLNADQLFYLKSRGLSTLEAKQLLVRGFCQEITDLLGGYSEKQRI